MEIKKNMAYVLALLLPLIRVGFLYPWHDIQSLPVVFINAAIRVVALLFYAYLIDRTAWQTVSLERKVKILEGILPICASCKRILNEKGEYEQIEHYVSEHSEASFSHGICPDCAKRLYPDHYKKKDE